VPGSASRVAFSKSCGDPNSENKCAISLVDKRLVESQ
jgi:hypothetical protein